MLAAGYRDHLGRSKASMAAAAKTPSTPMCRGGPILVDGRGGNDYIDVGDNTPTDATVYGGTGNDTMYVMATNSALVYGDDNDAYAHG